MKILGVFGRRCPRRQRVSGEAIRCLIGCARERRRDEGRPNDDLRARPDCFNRQIWLDESASEWGHRKRILQLSKLQVAGGVDGLMRGGVRVRRVFGGLWGGGGVAAGKCPRARSEDVPRSGQLWQVQVCDACLPHNPTRLTPDSCQPKASIPSQPESLVPRNRAPKVSMLMFTLTLVLTLTLALTLTATKTLVQYQRCQFFNNTAVVQHAFVDDVTKMLVGLTSETGSGTGMKRRPGCRRVPRNGTHHDSTAALPQQPHSGHREGSTTNGTSAQI